MPTAFLSDRGVVRLSGEAARDWLNNLVTCDVAGLARGAARFGALLSPQGKILVDFHLIQAPEADGGAILIDAPRALLPDLVKKLTLYRLRAKIAIDDLTETHVVAAHWGGGSMPHGIDFIDARLGAMGARIILPRADAEGLGDSDAYHSHRIALGVPEGGKDFSYGDAFPHEADMDQLHGVDFRKGCYVGQEVVSRMQHRGSGGRTRIVPVAYDGGFAASEGAEAKAGEKIVGSVGSNAGGRGLAKLRLDRVEEALAAGEALSAGGLSFTLRRPDWARFRFPGDAPDSAAG